MTGMSIYDKGIFGIIWGDYGGLVMKRDHWDD